MKIGKITKVDLRNVWPHEERDFSKWLSQEENLNALATEIGIDELNLIEVEKPVGSYFLDILAEEAGTGNKVVIENQLESTDHDHLGKILTYAAGVGANTIVWVAREVREEHRQAIDWLNENTGQGLNFFVIQIEALRIGESEVAPQFNIICKPNNWTKVSRSRAGGGNPETDEKKLKFWEEFKSYANSKGATSIRHSPAPQHWFNVAFGTSLAHIELTITTRKQHWVACGLYIRDDKELFERLSEKKVEINKSLGGGEIEWIEASKATRIVKRNMKLDPMSPKDKEECFDWLLRAVSVFENTFKGLIQEYERGA